MSQPSCGALSKSPVYRICEHNRWRVCTVSWGHLCTTVVTVLHQSPRGSTLKHIPLCPRILVFPASPPLHVWLSPSGSGLAGHLAGTSKSLLDPHLLSQRSWDSPGDVRVSQSRRKAAIPWLVMGKPSPLGEQRDTEPQGRVRAQTSHTAGPRMGAGARGWSQAGCWLRTLQETSGCARHSVADGLCLSCTVVSGAGWACWAQDALYGGVGGSALAGDSSVTARDICQGSEAGAGAWSCDQTSTPQCWSVPL